MSASLLDRELIYVTGKGGVGKTTVAASLGLAAAREGRRTIVCEVARQDRLFRAFARHGVDEDETELAHNLYAVTVDPQRALEEWLRKQLGGGIGEAMHRTLLRSSAFQYFVAAAPGAKELITIAKAWELAQDERWTKGRRTYDLVIVDAPASGHGVAMLQTPHTFGDIARVGPIKRQAAKVRSMLEDPRRTGYVAVALAEEMPVTETLELQGRLIETVGLPLELIVVNALLPERFTAREAAQLESTAQRDGHAAETAGMLSAALAELSRARAQRTHLRRLRRHADAKVITLPFLFEPDVGLASYERLARELTKRLP